MASGYGPMTATRSPDTGRIFIPPATLEKMAAAIFEADHLVSWDVVGRATKGDYRLIARAAALALLENWPDVVILETVPLKSILLPLTTETDNDKA